MKILRYIILLIFICLCFVVIRSLLTPIHPIHSASSNAIGALKAISAYIGTYYENAAKSGEDIQTANISKYLESECDGLSSHIFLQEPASTYGSPMNVGIYLCLPKVLKCESPTVIAYTEPIEENKMRASRAVLFLNETTMVAIEIDSYHFSQVLNNNAKVTPDFYFCLLTNKK